MKEQMLVKLRGEETHTKLDVVSLHITKDGYYHELVVTTKTMIPPVSVGLYPNDERYSVSTGCGKWYVAHLGRYVLANGLYSYTFWCHTFGR